MTAAMEDELRPEDDAHRRWKQNAAPMYDWMTNHHLVWPALACRFGEKRKSADDVAKYQQTIFYSEQVDKEEKTPNKLIMQTVNVHEATYAPVDHINSWKENQKSPYFSKSDKHIINHPGECNKIRDIRQHSNMVVTHSDVPDVFLWDFTKQADHNAPASKGKKNIRNTPDLKLVGHREMAPFALSTSSASPSIASGGEDTNVLVWNLEDQGEGDANRATRGALEVLEARATLAGHNAMVSDVCFKPGSDRMLASSADDHVVKLWDTREGRCIQDVQQVRSEDVLALDWSADGGLIATGDNTGHLQIYDLRKLSQNTVEPVFTFKQNVMNPRAVITVTWSPLKPAWISCGGDDGRVSVYDTSRPSRETADTLPAQLVLQHIGHLGNIMDAQWSPHDADLMMSVSNDGQTYKEGGAVQLWRLSWLLYAELEQVEARLSEYQGWLESGRMSQMPNIVAANGQPVPLPRTTPEPRETASEPRVDLEAGGAPDAGAAAHDGAAPMDASDLAAAEPPAADAPASEAPAVEEPGSHAPDAAEATAAAAAEPSPPAPAPAGDEAMAHTGEAAAGTEQSAPAVADEAEPARDAEMQGADDAVAGA